MSDRPLRHFLESPFDLSDPFQRRGVVSTLAAVFGRKPRSQWGPGPQHSHPSALGFREPGSVPSFPR